MSTHDSSRQSAPKRATISDVARVAGVSRGAVSKVIRDAYGVSPAMRAKVEEAIERLAYRPRTAARALRGSGFTIGLAFPGYGNDFFNQIVMGVNATLAGTGYRFILAPDTSESSSSDTLDALADREVDGIVAVSPMVSTDWLENLSRYVPIVVIGRHDMPRGYDTVNGDDAAGARLVMNHLFELGHRRIAHLTGDYLQAAARPADPHSIRSVVYREMMLSAGLVPQQVMTAPSQAAIAEATQELLSSEDPPTAIFAAHDFMAINALRVVAESSPRVALAGYDGVDMAGHPLISLTTVDQQGVEIGRAAATMLLERIKGRTTSAQYLSVPKLLVRRSTVADATEAQGDEAAARAAARGAVATSAV